MAIKLPPSNFDSEKVLKDTIQSLKGTDGNDEFIGTADGGATGGKNTAQPGDRNNGKGGDKDTFTLTVTDEDGSGDVFLPSLGLKNIEILQLSQVADYFQMDGDEISGLETVLLKNHVGGETDLDRMTDEFDMAFHGGSLEDAHNVDVDFIGDAWSGMSDTMELEFKNAYLDLDVDVNDFLANTGMGIENAIFKSKGSVVNRVDLNDFDGLTSVKGKGKTDLDLFIDNDIALSNIDFAKFKGDFHLNTDGPLADYYAAQIINAADGSAAQIAGGKGHDHLNVEGHDYLNAGSYSVDVDITTGKGADDIYAMYFNDISVGSGGGADEIEIDYVNNATVKASGGSDYVDVWAQMTADIDGGGGNNYIDAYAGGYGVLPTPAELDKVVLTITTGKGMDDIEAATGEDGDAVIASGGGNDYVDIEQVRGDVDVKAQGGDDDILVFGRGITEDDTINGGNGMDVLVAGGEDPSELALYDFYNGFNVLNDDDSFAGVSNLETVVILDDYDSHDDAYFDGEATGANDTDNGDDPAGISHYVLGDDYYGVSDNYYLSNMIDGVTLDVNVMGSYYFSDYSTVEDFELSTEGSGGEANINLISSAYHGDPSIFEDVLIEDTEVLNIGLQHVGEDGPEVTAIDEPGIAIFGNALDGGYFMGDDALEEVNVSGDLHFGSGIWAESLETYDASGMTGSAILGFFDVADDGVEISTGSGHDIVMGEDEDASFDVSTGEGTDIVIIMNDQDDVIGLGGGADYAFAGYGNDEINGSGGDDIVFFMGEDLNDADDYDGGSGTDTAVILDYGLENSESQFMNGFVDVENLVLGEYDDQLLLNAIASDAGIELVDLSMGGEDELMTGSGFEQDELTVLLSNEALLTHPLLDAHSGALLADVDMELGPEGLEVFSYNTDGVYVDTTASETDLTVSGIAATYWPGNTLMAGDGANDELVVIADDMGFGPDGEDTLGPLTPFFGDYFDDVFDGDASIAEFGEDTTGFESLTVLHDVDHDVGVVMDNANVASGLTFEVDATDLMAMEAPLADIEDGEDHDAGNFYFNGLAETDGSFLVNGGEGHDLLIGGNGSDEMNGNDGDDTIFGGLGGDNTLRGGDDDDVLVGFTGNDTLEGGDGEDTLIGGAGGDTLSGGDDDDMDVFVYNTGGEDEPINIDSFGSLGSDTIDTITDFDVANDKIDLSDFGVEEDFLFLGSFVDKDEIIAELQANGEDDLIEIAYDQEKDSLWVNVSGTDEELNGDDLRIVTDGVDAFAGTEFIFGVA